MSLKSRAAVVNAKSPDLVAEVTLYPSAVSGRQSALMPGYGCPCFAQKSTEQPGWDAWMQRGSTHFAPGQTRTVGFCFLSGEKAAAEIRKVDTFYLWEMGFIGEAKVIDSKAR